MSWKDIQLSNYRWINPLLKIDKISRIKSISDQICENLFYINNDYLVHLKYIQIITVRLGEDYESVIATISSRHTLLDKIRTMPNDSDYIPNTEESQSLSDFNYHIMKFKLDYKSFILFSKILLDKLAKLASCIYKGSNLPSDSFTKHKKYFQDHPKFEKNQAYADLIINKTNWFDLFLLPIRDKMHTHGNTRHHALITGKNDFNIIETVNFSARRVIGDLLILKEKYQSRYPAVSSLNGAYELILFFMLNDISMNKNDVVSFHSVILKCGTFLPDLRYLIYAIQDFLSHFARIVLEGKFA